MLTLMKQRQGVLLLAATVVFASQACQKSTPTRPDGSASAPAEQPSLDAWGATLGIPKGFHTEQNDTGGWEMTDGKIVILVGRHELPEGTTATAFFEERRQALSSYGAVDMSAVKTTPLGRGTAIAATGRATSEGEEVQLRLAATRLGPRAGLSLLMIHEPRSRARADETWRTLLQGTHLP